MNITNKTITSKEIDRTSPQYIWAKIKTYCVMNNIKQTELADITGLSTVTISNYNSDPTPLRYETISKFCKAYHIDSISTLENL